MGPQRTDRPPPVDPCQATGLQGRYGVDVSRPCQLAPVPNSQAHPAAENETTSGAGLIIRSMRVASRASASPRHGTSGIERFSANHAEPNAASACLDGKRLLCVNAGLRGYFAFSPSGVRIEPMRFLDEGLGYRGSNWFTVAEGRLMAEMARRRAGPRRLEAANLSADGGQRRARGHQAAARRLREHRGGAGSV